MIVLVPCTPGGSALWTQRSALDGTDYVLTFDWNQRGGFWAMHLADSDGAMIRASIVLAAGVTFLRGVTDARRPAGELLVVDMTAAGDLDPGFSDLGTRFVLAYYDAAELGR